MPTLQATVKAAAAAATTQNATEVETQDAHAEGMLIIQQLLEY